MAVRQTPSAVVKWEPPPPIPPLLLRMRRSLRGPFSFLALSMNLQIPAVNLLTK
jgi:hypothetical protein